MTYGDDSGRYLRPMAIDGDVDFIEVDSRQLAGEAQEILAVQWDFIHGDLGAEDLDQLPEQFEGRLVVRTARELAELARIGAFGEIEEIYRQLYE